MTQATLYLSKLDVFDIYRFLHVHHLVRSKLDKITENVNPAYKEEVKLYELELSEILKALPVDHCLRPRLQKAGENKFRW